MFLSFDNFSHYSLSIKCIAHQANKYVLPAYELITNSFETKNFNQIPNNAIEDLRIITRFARKYECHGAFYKDVISVAGFTQFTDVKYNDSEAIRGQTTIHGVVQIAGGKKILRATLKINKNYTLSIEVGKDIAKKLAAQLYNEVGLKGIAKWDKRTYRILDFKVDEVIILDERSINDTFMELCELLGEPINKKGFYNYIN